MIGCKTWCVNDGSEMMGWKIEKKLIEASHPHALGGLRTWPSYAISPKIRDSLLHIMFRFDISIQLCHNSV